MMTHVSYISVMLMGVVMYPGMMVESARHPIMGGRGVETGRDENGCPADLPDTTATAQRGQYCYQFVDKEMYWTHARNYCWKYGGWLVTINDASTNSFIVRTLNSLSWDNSGVWIGLHDRSEELNWGWVTGLPYEDTDMTWSNWASGHPRGFLHSMRDCIRMKRGRHDDWKWHETTCAVLKWTYNFICQYELPPTTPAPTTLPSPNRVDMLYGSQRSTQPPPTTTVPTTTRLTTTSAVPSSVEYDFGWSEDYHPEYDSYAHVNYDSYEDYEKETFAPRGDIQHSKLVQEMAAVEKTKKNHGIIIVVCAVLTILSVSLLIFIIVFTRRRRQQEKEEALNIQNPTYAGKDVKPTPVDRKIRAENEYVINVYNNPLPATEKLLGIPPPKEEDVQDTCSPGGENDYEAAEDFRDNCMKERALPATPAYLAMDGSQKMMTSMSGYETPIDSHTYAEIPGADEQIYESLEDLQFKHTDY